MTRILTRNSSLSVVAAFFAILTLVIAAAVLAQTSGTGQSSGNANAVLAPVGASAPAQAERPLSPWTGAGSSPVVRPHTKRHGASLLASNLPLFLPMVEYGSGGGLPDSVAVADVNGDGKPDLLVANSGSSTVGVLLGNGDGTFQAATSYGSGGFNEWPQFGSVAAADVNGDGRVDLVVSNTCVSGDNCSSGTVGVLLGNGDGTFQPVVIYRSGAPAARSVAIADLNGDGKPDVVVANCGNSSRCPGGGVVGVLLGNGDGTFHAAVAYGSGGWGTNSVAVADVNGDGQPDLVTANWNGRVGVLLGYGDGTFRPAVSYGSGAYTAMSVAVGDVNGDGKPDLVTANWIGGSCSSGDGAVGVLLGNGDGTFQTAVSYDSGGCLYIADSVAVADVNGDSKPDLLVANYCASGGCSAASTVVGVLLGNGDGTFQPVVTYHSGFYTLSLAVADLNGDGAPDLAVVNVLGVAVLLHVGTTPTTTTLVSAPNPSVFGQMVFFTAVVTSSSGTPAGEVELFEGSASLGSATLTSGTASVPVSSLAARPHSIIALYHGSLKFHPSTSDALNQVVTIAASETSLASSHNPGVVKQGVTYTATVMSQYGGAATGTATFQDGGSTIATVSLAGNRAAYSTSYQTAGTHAITAIYSGDANNAGSTSPTLLEQIKGFASKTVLTTSGSPSFVGQRVTFTATVTSTLGTIPDGELVTFYDGITPLGSVALASGTAAYTTSSLSTKTHTIKATYVGDTRFAPSSGMVKQVVNKYPTTTGLSSSLNPSNYGQAVTFTATVTPTGPYSLTAKVRFWDGTVGIGTATLSGGVAKLTKSTLAVGMHPITAQYLGDSFNAKSTSTVLDQVVQ
jgi:Bacterial Ig-like domain (group 3)/FG-GAP-like repeat